MTGVPISLFFSVAEFLNSNNLFSAVLRGIWGFGICFVIGQLPSKVLAYNVQHQIDYRSQKTVVFVGIIIFFIITLMITVSLLDGHGLLDAFHQPNYQKRDNIFLEGIVGGALSIAIFLVSLPSLNAINGWLPEKKTVNLQPNQGIRGSFKRFLATIILLPLPLILLNETLQTGFDDERIFAFLGILGFSTFLGTFFGLMHGGMACIKHFSMRLVLCAIAKVIPWNYARFLDYCVERRLLRRIGGRYRFLHRELLEHFADKAGGVS